MSYYKIENNEIHVGNLPHGEGWVKLDPKNKPQELIDLELQQLKDSKLAKIQQELSKIDDPNNKDLFLNTSLGFPINARRIDVGNIAGLIRLKVTTIRDFNNKDHDITVEELVTLELELTQYGLQRIQHGHQLKQQLIDAKTEEEIKAVTWSL